jgi:hypothetical protein
MLQKTVRLNHPIKYHDAVYEQRNVYVHQNNEIIGYGRIVDVTQEAVTVINHETQQFEHYLRFTGTSRPFLSRRPERLVGDDARR